MKNLCPLRAPNLASRVFQGEAIIMNPADSGLFNLNETATALWLAADGRTTLEQIVERHICPAYDVAFDLALADAEELSADLAKRSILLLVDPGATA